MKKILFITPTPTHPSNAGNRVHILSLASVLKNNGWEVHCLYLAYEDFDKTGMQNLFGEFLYIIDRDQIYKRDHWRRDIPRRVKLKLERGFRWLQFKIGFISGDQFKFNSGIDDNFPPIAGQYIRHLDKLHCYQATICEYVFMSKALKFIHANAFKILDTHDLFTDRYKVYLKNGLKPSWVSLYKDQESKALKRADLVISVQEKEKTYFETIANSKVIRYSYVPDVVRLPKRKFEKKLLYFASDNAINKVTLYYFIETIFPLIIKKHPETILLVGGSLCRTFSTIRENVIMVGEFQDPAEFYSLGDVAINPEPSGTGYKIKTVEAMAYGLPLVSTGLSAEGLMDPFMDHILIANEPKEFSEAVIKLFDNPLLCEAMGKNAQNWIVVFQQRLRKNLFEQLPTK